MTTPMVEIFEIGEVGLIRCASLGPQRNTRVTFAMMQIGTKEEEPTWVFPWIRASRRHRVLMHLSSLVLIFGRRRDGHFKVIPFPFPIASVQKLPGCLENRSRMGSASVSNVEKILPVLWFWVLCGHTVYHPIQPGGRN